MDQVLVRSICSNAAILFGSQFGWKRDDDMNNHIKRHLVVCSFALLSPIVGWGDSQAQEPSADGAYALVEVNGEQLPANLWTEKSDGQRCKQVILKGVLLLDSEGRSAAFLTERVFCPSEGGTDNEGLERSVIFAGSYSISGNEITLQDDFGTDRAVIEGDLLFYETGGDGRPVEKFVFRKE